MSKPIFSFQAYYDFCKSKYPLETYDYYNSHNCACGQYANTIGMNFYEAKKASGTFKVFDDLASKYPRTFGDLANRLREYL